MRSRLTRRRRSRDSGRLLATVLFTDIVGSTERAVELGDRRWRELVAAHHGFVRKQLKRFGGREVDTAGDGFFVTFAQPAPAIECARAIVDGLATMGIQVRVGLHMGEVEVRGNEIRGVAVHMGARIMSAADPGEILVSSTVRDLMAGSDVQFEDRGLQELKGVPQPWHLFAATPLPIDISEAPSGVSTDEEAPGNLLPRRVLVSAIVALVVAGAAALALTREWAHPSAKGVRTTGVITAPDNAALQIDPVSGRVRATVAGLRAGIRDAPARHIEVGEGGVWIDTAITLQHINPRTGTLVGQIQAQPFVSSIAVGQGAIWASGSVGITRISPATDRIESTIVYQTAQARPIRIVVAGGDVWMLVTDGRLIRVDAGTNLITQRRVIGASGADLAVSPGALWVLDPASEKVIEIDPKTARVLRRIPVPGNLENLKRIVVSSGWIWVMDENAGVVTPIDPATGVSEAPIRVGAQPVDMAFGLGAVWVANRGDGTITRIDPTLLETRTIHVGGSIAAIAVDAGTRTLWAYLTQSDTPVNQG